MQPEKFRVEAGSSAKTEKSITTHGKSMVGCYYKRKWTGEDDWGNSITIREEVLFSRKNTQ